MPIPLLSSSSSSSSHSPPVRFPRAVAPMADRNDREKEDLAGYRPGVILGGKWKIMELLDEGGFGKVYRVQDMTNPSLSAALKIESIRMDGGSAIKLERSALERIHQKGTKEHVPMLYRSSRRKNINYMIVTLLGDNLRRIKDKYYPKGYPLKCWVKVAIQSLVAIKTVHDAGFVHRDVKAPNFVFGHPNDTKKARIVHIIDFGLARQYALDDQKRKGAYRPRAARPHTDFRGTWNYASPSMHDYVELGRKDDIWSLIFMLMDLHASLPWVNCDSLDAIGKMKQNMKDEELMMKLPSELIPVTKHLRTLDVYNRPNYSMIYECFDKVFVKNKASWLEPYDWESREVAVRNLAYQQSIKQMYTDPGPFFYEDPVKINVGPSKYSSSDDQVSRVSAKRSTTSVNQPSKEQPSSAPSGSAERASSAENMPMGSKEFVPKEGSNEAVPKEDPKPKEESKH